MRSTHKKLLFTLSGLFVVYLILNYVYEINEEVMVGGWEYGVDRNISHYISDYKTTPKLIPSTFCDKFTVLIVMVCSAPENFLARKAIRETWGNSTELGNNVSLYFLLGQSVDASVQYIISLENNKYGDIIQDHFLDTYNNLTLKSVTMLKVVSQYCLKSTRFLMKVDDDMFLNVNMLMKMLESRTLETDLLVGKLICGAKPIKDVSSKWFAPRYLFESESYPNYLSGTGYVMSIDVVYKLYKTALETPIFHLEDVYLTGICASKVNIRPIDDAHFTFNELTHEPCLIKHLYTAHHFNFTYMIEMYGLINNGDMVCPNRTFETNQWVAENIKKRDRSFRHVNCGNKAGKFISKKRVN